MLELIRYLSDKIGSISGKFNLALSTRNNETTPQHFATACMVSLLLKGFVRPKHMYVNKSRE